MFSADIDRALSLDSDAAVEALLALPEGQWFERKSGAIKPTDFAVPLVAMANAEGGVVVAGLHGGEVVPVDDDADNTLRQVPLDYTRPQVRASVRELRSRWGRVLVFQVAPGRHVHETNRGECYQRVGDESRRLAYRQRQELEWDRGAVSFDATPAPGVSVADLDAERLEEYRQALGSSSPELALRARDLLTREGDVTVAGYLLFARRPQLLYPNAHVRVVRYLDDERGVGRGLNVQDGGDVRCEGSIPEQVASAVEAVGRLIPRRRALTGSGRFEPVPVVPRDAWLEGLVNAVVHRSYSVGGDHVRVEIFPSRVEITSPGRFPGVVDPTSPESIGRFARNPRIARVCADLGLTQELGEGVRRIFAEMRRAGLVEPVYVQGPEAVRLTLCAAAAVPEELGARLGVGAMRVLDALRLARRPLGTGEVVDLVGMARPTVLRHLGRLRDAGLVVWEGASARDPQATWRVG